MLHRVMSLEISVPQTALLVTIFLLAILIIANANWYYLPKRLHKKGRGGHTSIITRACEAIYVLLRKSYSWLSRPDRPDSRADLQDPGRPIETQADSDASRPPQDVHRDYRRYDSPHRHRSQYP